MTSLKPIKTHKINIFEIPLGVPGPLVEQPFWRQPSKINSNLAKIIWDQ